MDEHALVILYLNANMRELSPDLEIIHIWCMLINRFLKAVGPIRLYSIISCTVSRNLLILC